MNNSPLVSVIMPIYNDYLFLEDAIESILNQTFSDFEFIICNDGSLNNATLSILDNYSKKDRIVYIQNSHNLGLPASLNKCISISRGKYIARMDGDDISKPDRLEKQVLYLEQHQNVAAISSFARVIDENNICVGHISNPKEPRFKDVLEKVRFVHPASMFRKEALIKSGLYSIEKDVLLGRCEDYDLWCRLYENNQICHNLPEELLLYREVSDSYKKRKRKTFRFSYLVKKRWMKKHKELHPSKKTLLTSYLQGIIPSRVAFSLHRKKIRSN